VTTEDAEKIEDASADEAKATKAPAKRASTRAAKGTARKAAPKKAASSPKGESAADGKAKASEKATPAKKAAGGRAAKTGTGRGTRRRAPAKETAEVAAPAVVAEVSAPSVPRLQALLREEIGPQMVREFEYSTPMQIPRPTKVILNIGLGEALENSRAIASATGDLVAITGQRPVVRRARKSIAQFKLREGQAIGLSVTMRGRRMYQFLDRLLSSSLPRIRDFNGVSRDAFDGRGNYSIGLREQIIFPEIDYNAIDRIRGLQIVIVTSAFTDREGFRLLELMGMPFARIGDGRAA